MHPNPILTKKINPPLRPESDRKTVEKAVSSGLIDTIATDHAPHSEEEKNTDFIKAPSGSIGFETFLPVTFNQLVKRKKISMLEWIKLVSYQPAKILGIERGFIEEGQMANLAIFNPYENFIVTKKDIASKSKNSAFLGRKYSGRVKFTIFKGKLVFQD